MNTAEVVAAYLSAAGVERVYGYPGDPNVALIEALRAGGIEFVLATREGTAGLMAEAAGMIGASPGVCLSTLGPGSTNLVNAVANATLDRAPMIALSGQIDTRRRPIFTHQVVDHARLFAPVAKWVGEIGPANAGAVMRKAHRTAVAERPGAVHVSTPADLVAAEAGDDEVRVAPASAARGAAQVFAGAAAADPVAALAAASRPLLLYGMAARRAAAGEAIAVLAERLGCPLVSSPMAKGTVPEDHPLFAGVLDMACNRILWELLGRADRIVAVGFDAVELIKPWSPSAPVLHLDAVPNTDQIYPADIEVVGSIVECVEALAGALPARETWPRAEIEGHRERLRAQYLEGWVRGRLNPTDVVGTVRAALPREAIATTDVGSHKLLVGQGWRAFEPGGVVMSNGLSSMGFALPAAMVARLEQPEREVVCFTGDGGLAMVQGELRLAASLGLAITVVVFCDDSLNRIELKQAARQFPSIGTRFEPTDIELLARSMGCEGIAIDQAGALAAALEGPRPHDRPLVIGARIDPGQYQAQF